MMKKPRRSEVLRFSPNGSRTRVTAVRGRRPRPLDDRAVYAPGDGFEPPMIGSEPIALPLGEPGFRFVPSLFFAANVSV